MSVDIMQAMVGAAGHALARFGGARVTRLSAAAAIDDTTLSVEGAAWAPASGQVRVDNVTYRYTGVDVLPGGGTLKGIAVRVGGVWVPGVLADHLAGTGVTLVDDGSSDVQAFKDSLFVETATGPALAVIGRYLGVPHVVTLSSDAQYSELIQAVAYKPRGTAWALKSALDVLAGPGQYEIVEDPTKPGTVTVEVPYASVQSTQAIGHTYLSPTELLRAQADGTLSVPRRALGHGALLLAPERSTFDSAQGSIAGQLDANGDPFWQASADATVTTGQVGTAAYTRLQGGKGRLTSAQRPLRVTGAAEVGLQAQLVVTPASALSTTDGRACAVWAADGSRLALVGATATTDGRVLWALRSATGAALGSGVSVGSGSQASIALRLVGDVATLVVDRRPAGQVLRSSLPASSARELGLGNWSGAAPAAASTLSVRTLGCSADVPTDYGVARGTDAAPAPATDTATFGRQTIQRQAITLPSLALAATDVGRRLDLTSGGRGVQGNYLVTAVTGPHTAQVTGVPHVADATLNVVNGANVLRSADERAFAWPNDLGKTLVLADNTAGNAGAYTVTDVLDARGQSLGAGLTPRPAAGGAVVLGGPRLNPQARLGFTLWPAFTAGSTAAWRFGDALDQLATDTLTTWTPRQPLPLPGALYTMVATEVVGGYLTADSNPSVLVDEGPPVTADNYPFYVESPFGALGDYLAGLTPAGSTAGVDYT